MAIKLRVGLKYKTINTHRGAYNKITKLDDRYAEYETVYDNGMHPATETIRVDLERYLNTPNIRLQILN